MSATPLRTPARAVEGPESRPLPLLTGTASACSATSPDGVLLRVRNGRHQHRAYRTSWSWRRPLSLGAGRRPGPEVVERLGDHSRPPSPKSGLGRRREPGPRRALSGGRWPPAVPHGPGAGPHVSAQSRPRSSLCDHVSGRARSIAVGRAGQNTMKARLAVRAGAAWSSRDCAAVRLPADHVFVKATERLSSRCALLMSRRPPRKTSGDRQEQRISSCQDERKERRMGRQHLREWRSP